MIIVSDAVFPRFMNQQKAQCRRCWSSQNEKSNARELVCNELENLRFTLLFVWRNVRTKEDGVDDNGIDDNAEKTIPNSTLEYRSQIWRTQ